ncbi:hypothetical protein ILUMI_03118 [Ignelater luminosus]|uniref:Lipocalin/cytosolic fatty-acid binding domain-containing protein n=1 Tax=Ignelater luminosus TaxID=2038154 RepID=A0A8K0DGE1_IGNLU|nr:hypothetical protein ILUMI_03118 [Ignelater luminosus]
METSKKIIFLFIFLSAVFAEDELIFDGKCPEEVATVDKFDYETFSGVWYEIKRYPNTIITEECAVARYIPLKYNNYNLTYLSRNIEKKTTTKRQLVYDKEIIKSNDIKYDVYFKCKKDNFQHHVLYTDYVTFSIVWGCIDNKNDEDKEENKQRLFVYSRTKTLDDEALEKIEKKLAEHGIDHSQLQNVEQKIEVCGDVIAEAPVWKGCPDEACNEMECTVPTRFGI